MLIAAILRRYSAKCGFRMWKLGAIPPRGKLLLTHILKSSAKFVEYHTDGLQRITLAPAR